MFNTFEGFETSIVERKFWDWLTGKKAEGNPAQAVQGKMSGLVDPEVEKFYQELEDFATSGKAVAVKTNQNMKYSKLVEDIQIALSFLGFPLPRFGVDGMFGPETAAAISKFNVGTQTALTAESLLGFDDFLIIYEAANGKLTPTDLVSLPEKPDEKLNPIAAKAYEKMVAAATADGVTWKITDSYRDYVSQQATAKSKGLYATGGLAANPGQSNHGWGSALDLALTPSAQAWLIANASKYGFSSIGKEPWHWEHKASAASMKAGNVGPTQQTNTVIIDGNLITRLISNLKSRHFGQTDLEKFIRKEGVTLTSAEDDEFYKAILKSIGANETPEKIKFLKAWRQGEGGKATNNPFNTTKKMDVPGITNYNSAGVKNYPDKQTGLNATVATIKLPYYRRLLRLLQNDRSTANDLAMSPDLHTWGTGDMVSKVLSTGKVNPPPIYT
jgi:hypothetical protein